MSRYQTEQKKKKELNEEEEYLRQVDVPESQGGGRKYVVDKIEDDQKKIKRAKDNVKTDLQTKQGKPFSYREVLANYGNKLLKECEFDKGWEYVCLPTDGRNIMLSGRTMKTDYGILMVIKSPNGNVYSRGVKTTNDAVVDAKAIEVLATQAENTADSEKGILLERDGTKKTKSGIYIV